MKTIIFLTISLLLIICPVYALINSISVTYSNFGIDVIQTGDLNYLFSDNFNDGTIAPWGATNGSWTAASNRAETAGAGSNVLQLPNLDLNITNVDYNFRALFHPNNVGTSMVFHSHIGNSSINPQSDGDGYYVYTEANGAGSPFNFVKVLNGSPTTLISGTANITSGNDYNVWASRVSGVWKTYLNGTQVGTSSTDSQFNHFDTLYLEANGPAGSWFDDVNVFAGVPQTNKYVNELDYNVAYNCASVDANVKIAINDSNMSPSALNCDGVNNNLLGTYQHPTQGFFNIKFFSIDTTNNIHTKFSDQNFISDLNNPSTSLSTSPITGGFAPSISNINLLLTCTDTISPILVYDINNLTTGNIILNVTDDANLTKMVAGSAVSGQNDLVGKCTDLAGNFSLDFNSANVFNACFNLVDEETGIDWTATDINNTFEGLRAVAYSDGNFYDFKANLTTNICFTSIEDDTIRFDINYNSGLMLYREFNLTLVNDLNLGSADLNVCLATPQDFFEQLFISSQQTPVFLQNILSECYSLVDYTKYAHEDSLSHRAFTISAPYTLVTYRDGNALDPITLTIVNGAVEDVHQLDVLIFKANPLNVNLQPDELTISPYYTSPDQTDTNTIQVVYQNLSENNLTVQIQIFDDTNLLVTQLITSTPNDFTAYFNLGGYTINADVLRLVLTKTLANGQVEVITRYFTMRGAVPFTAPVAAILAFLFFIFVFTVVGWQSSLGIFGFMVTMVSLGILALAPTATWVVILQAVFLIGGVYIGLIYNNATTKGF